MKPWNRTWLVRGSILTGFAVFLLLEALTGGDLRVGRGIWDPQLGWHHSYHPPWSWLNDQGERATFVLLGLGALFLARRVQRGETFHRRSLLAILVVLVLGPGVTVKALRDFWGRPRPRDVIELGGNEPHRSWWEPLGPGHGKSFPSGHTALAASLLIFASIPGVRERTALRRTLLGATVGYTALLGYARMLRGAHHLSDVVWSALLVWIVVQLAERVLLFEAGAPGPGDTDLGDSTGLDVSATAATMSVEACSSGNPQKP